MPPLLPDERPPRAAAAFLGYECNDALAGLSLDPGQKDVKR